MQLNNNEEYWPEVMVVRTERSEVRTKRPSANIPQYGPKHVKLVISLLYGIIFIRNNTSSSSLKSISGAVPRKEASDFTAFKNSLTIVPVDR